MAELGKGDDLATPGLEKKAVVVETAMAERSSSVAWAGWLSSFSDLVVGGKGLLAREADAVADEIQALVAFVDAKKPPMCLGFSCRPTWF